MMPRPRPAARPTSEIPAAKLAATESVRLASSQELAGATDQLTESAVNAPSANSAIAAPRPKTRSRALRSRANASATSSPLISVSTICTTVFGPRPEPAGLPSTLSIPPVALKQIALIASAIASASHDCVPHRASVALQGERSPSRLMGAACADKGVDRAGADREHGGQQHGKDD